jgi:hypothetical protein
LGGLLGDVLGVKSRFRDDRLDGLVGRLEKASSLVGSCPWSEQQIRFGAHCSDLIAMWLNTLGLLGTDMNVKPESGDWWLLHRVVLSPNEHRRVSFISGIVA